MVLKVPNVAGIETKNLKCPNCKMTASFVEFRKVQLSEKDDDETLHEKNDGTQLNNIDKTKISSDDNPQGLGSLVMQPNGPRLPLQRGVNIVGRESSSITVEVPVPTDSKFVSRRHAKIEVCQVKGRGLVYYLSNAENKNSTKVNGSMLSNGDRVILNNGDEVQLADVKLVFEIQ